MLCPLGEQGMGEQGYVRRGEPWTPIRRKDRHRTMRRPSEVKWFRLRVAFALGVLALLVVELSGHRTWLVVVPQALFIVGIIVTSVLDLRDLRRHRGGAQRPNNTP